MRALKSALRVTLCSLTMVLAAPTPSFPDLGLDPFGLSSSSKELSEAAQRIMIQLRELEGIANYDVKQRLEQVRSIMRDAVSGVEDVIHLAMTAMLILESQVNQDAVRLIYIAKCQADVLLMTDAQKAFSQFIAKIIKADTSIKIFGIRVIDLTANNIDITEPDQAYISTKTAVLTELNKKTSDASKAYEILSAYQNLENGAKFVRCNYPGQVLQVKYTEEVNDL
jgi:hypothetical protein